MSLIAFATLAPLAAALWILLFKRWPAAIALIACLLGLLASVGLLLSAINGNALALQLPGLPGMPLILSATPLTALLSTLVAVVSSLVLIYAGGYMQKDPEQPRFFATLLLFITAMQVLVLAGDWLLLLSAWEIIGLSSYLLIGFWYQRPGVSAAATRAFMVTRSADLGLYIAAFLLIAETGSSHIETTLNSGSDTASVAGLLLLIAAMGKSAQTPLHNWLQRAMAGPTPVSALLHSATLVAAGAILLIRSAPMLSADTLLIIGIVGGMTTVVTGLIAIAEDDLKRLLAASTSSQYGLMLLAIGAGVPLAALLHLLAHAAIKSSLFLGAGVFQHSRNSTRFADLAGMGRQHRRILLGFTVAALALAGIPPLSGFFSKDAIIAATLVSPHALLLASFAVAGTLLTGTYMARALRLLWLDEHHEPAPINNALRQMALGFAGLVVLAAILGATFPSISLWLGEPIAENGRGQIIAQALGLSAAIAGLFLGWRLSEQRLLGALLPWAQNGFVIAGGLTNWLVRPALVIAHACNWLEDRLYQAVLAIGQSTIRIAQAARFSDERGIDAFIFALVRGTTQLGHRARSLQSGLIHREMALSVIGIALLFAILLFGLFAGPLAD